MTQERESGPELYSEAAFARGFSRDEQAVLTARTKASKPAGFSTYSSAPRERDSSLSLGEEDVLNMTTGMDRSGSAALSSLNTSNPFFLGRFMSRRMRSGTSDS